MNNKYTTCPPQMADGRLFTDYRPNDYVNNLMRMASNTKSCFAYRKYLTENAQYIMEANNEYIKDKTKCGPCNGKDMPFRRECDYSLSNMNCEVTNKNGLGTYNNTRGAGRPPSKPLA